MLPCVLGVTLLVACGDPRGRLAPPTVEVTLADGGTVPTPGVLRATVHATDENGLDSIVVSVRSSDLRIAEDTAFFALDAFDTSHDLEWLVPAGLADSTRVQVVARVVSYLRFSASDTATGYVRHGILTAR